MTKKQTLELEPVQIVNDQPALVQPMDPMALISLSVQRGDDVEKMQQLFALKKDFEEYEAKKAYHSAFSAFKTESIEIIKNKNVSFKTQQGDTTSYNHASLDHILELTVPLMAKHGLSHNWRTEQGDGGRVTVTCILTHSLGYSEERALTAAPDDSGKKNNIQRIASTVTYLERYTFLAVTGLAAKDQDDDGASTGERYDKKAFEEGMTQACKTFGHTWYEYADVITTMKDQLADGNLVGAAEALYSLPNSVHQNLFRAPTKGGIFTPEESKLMSKTSPEWNEAIQEGIKLNPDVDRSI